MVNEFVNLIPHHAHRYGEREALRFRDYATGEWTSLSWNGMKREVERVALAMLLSGVEEDGKIAIFTNNCPEVLITHFAAFYNRAVPVPIYATSSKDEAAFIINNSGATVLLAGEQRQYEVGRDLLDECPSLKLVVTLNPAITPRDDDKRVITWQPLPIAPSC